MRRDMQKEVAILETVGSRLALPIPTIVTYDASTHNVFEKTYMIQTRLPGENLGTQLWKTLNIDQKTCVAKRVTALASEIAEIEGPAGEISFETLSHPPHTPICVTALSTPEEQEDKLATVTNPLEHLLERYEQWRGYQSRQRFFCHLQISRDTRVPLRILRSIPRRLIVIQPSRRHHLPHHSRHDRYHRLGFRRYRGGIHGVPRSLLDVDVRVCW
jgi:hypothetical protein